MPTPTPRQFCQEQLLLLGDEELLPLAQAATLEILHSTVMKDPDGLAFEARLEVLAAASTEDGTSLAAAAHVAQVLLDAWQQAQAS
ncbi:MAG: hypothetical protein JO057_07165 [Chloroflexi bacterium]|nr:hypothetical protein [Chloroflexota bacterium]